MLKPVEVGLYVHIPFCVRKCLYCDFNSYAGMESLMGAYVESLVSEAALAAATAASSGERYVARTLFLGGGTPSLLTAAQLASVLDACAGHFDWRPTLETTVEANPGTVDRPYLAAIRDLGVNRVSLGLQSLDEAELRSLGRLHSAEEGMLAYRLCREAGIPTVSLDLMYALSEQSLEKWESTLHKAISLDPDHISLYPLTVEPGTPFHRMQQKGLLTLTSQDESAQMYEDAEDTLSAAGYEHYEISNWARTGGTRRCEHNLIYWRNEPYLGLGAGAHSYLDNARRWNVASVRGYVGEVGSGRLPVEGRELLPEGVTMAEMAILGLRTSDGIRRDAFLGRFQTPLDDVFHGAINSACYLGLLVDTGEAIVLSPRGKLLGNEVFVLFLDEIRDRS